MDYSSKEHDEFLVKSLSELKSVAIGSCYTKLLSNMSTLLNFRRILFMATNEMPWGKRKYHQLLLQTSTTVCNQHEKKLKEHNHPRVDRRTRHLLYSDPSIINFSGSGQALDILDDNSINSSESSCSSSKNHALQEITKCSVVNKCEHGLDVVILQDSSDESSRISKEWIYSGEIGFQSIEDSLRLQDAQACKSNIDNANILTSIPLKEKVNGVATPCANHEILRRSSRLTSFIGDQLKEAVVPIGEHFQASIPDCIGPLCYEHDLDNSKWLGETIWPHHSENMDADKKIIGKGRPDSSVCSCMEHGSSDCIKLHIQEKKELLRYEICDAYYLWDFERMGEEVSKSWTPEEQVSFENLFRRNTSMSKGRFWKQIFHLFPDKRRENIVSYYFNVFALNNIRKQATIRCHVIDSDDDEPNNNYSI